MWDYRTRIAYRAMHESRGIRRGNRTRRDELDLDSMREVVEAEAYVVPEAYGIERREKKEGKKEELPVAEEVRK